MKSLINVLPVVTTPWNIELWWRAPTGLLRTYDIPIERVGEPDWLDHIGRKAWATRELMQRLEVELEVARRPGFVCPPVKGVYVIKSSQTSYWKVGMSNDCRKRIAAIGEGVPFDVRPVMFIPTNEPRELEATMLSALAHYIVKGEWLEVNSIDGVLDVYRTIHANDGGLRVIPAELFRSVELTATSEDESMLPPRPERRPLFGRPLSELMSEAEPPYRDGWWRDG